MANNLRSDLQRNSRYISGGKSTIVGDNIGWWERTVFAKSPLDVQLVITKQYAGRPNKLAFDLYGKDSLQWFVLQYNNITDITTEFVEGMTLTLPTRSRLFAELLTTSSVLTTQP